MAREDQALALAKRAGHPIEEHQLLRWVRLGEGYTLLMWDSYETGGFQRAKLGYCLARHGKPIFSSKGDYSPAPSDSIDSDASVWGLLAFLTLAHGDTDEEFFEHDTEAMQDFRRSDKRDELSMLVFDYENGDSEHPKPRLRNLLPFGD